MIWYDVYETETFSKLYSAMEKEEREWVNKIKIQLKSNPYVGKPLKFDWFREKKFGNKRLYFLVYKNLNKVLLVSFGTKKDQQEIINHIIENKDRYKYIIESV